MTIGVDVHRADAYACALHSEAYKLVVCNVALCAALLILDAALDKHVANLEALLEELAHLGIGADDNLTRSGDAVGHEGECLALTCL